MNMDIIGVIRPRPEVTVVTLQRPESLNAMSYPLVAALHDVIDDIERDDACRVVVLTGAGRGFCSGFDLKDPGALPGSDDLGRVQRTLLGMREFYGVITRLNELRQPVIAAVNGPAAGGGFGLALAADVRVASTSARFNVAFVRVGYSGCDIAVSYFLPRLIGQARAAELMLTGRLIDADEALRIGLVHEVVADGEVVESALRVADGIIANSPFGVAMTKEVMWLNLDAPSLRSAIAMEQRTNALTIGTEDRAEAIAAFLEGRAPQFRNR
jgi:enoyl-CoA hydratase